MGRESRLQHGLVPTPTPHDSVQVGARRTTALVTGASGGLGSLVTAKLLGDGWQVFATMRSLEARARLDQALAATGTDASELTLIPLELNDGSGIERGIAAAVAHADHRLDALVACA